MPVISVWQKGILNREEKNVGKATRNLAEIRGDLETI
jgi:hypothetical protein